MNQGFPTIYIGSLRSETLEVQFLQQKIHFLVWDRSDPFWSIFWEVTPTPERDKNRGNHHEKHIDITHACWIYSPIDEWMHNLQFYPVFKNTKFMDVIPSNLLPVSVASANPYSWFNQPAIPVSLQWSLSLSHEHEHVHPGLAFPVLRGISSVFFPQPRIWFCKFLWQVLRLSVVSPCWCLIVDALRWLNYLDFPFLDVLNPNIDR